MHARHGSQMTNRDSQNEMVNQATVQFDMREIFNDPLEYLRGAICAMSYVSSRQGREVHVLRLRHAFERAALVQSFRSACAAASFIREIQPLERGFWIPAPARAVPFGEYSLILAPNTTMELRRRFGSTVRNAGYGRMAQSTELGDVPVQALVEWMGGDTLHVDDWTEQQLSEARSQLKPTFAGRAEFEVFDPLVGYHRFPSASAGRWSPDIPTTHSSGQALRLCRKETAVGRYRFFFGQTDRGHLAAESPFVGDVARMQIGLLRKGGGSPSVMVEAKGEVVELQASVFIPQAERRFLAAIGRRVVKSEGYGRKYEIPNLAVGTLSELVRRLGCTTESH